MINITKLATSLEMKDSILLIKIVKGIKSVTEKRLFDNNTSHMCAIMPNNVSDLKQHCVKKALSIIKKTLIPKYINCRYIINVLADKPIEFGLLRGLPIAMIDPCNKDEGISKMTGSIFGHGKGL